VSLTATHKAIATLTLAALLVASGVGATLRAYRQMEEAAAARKRSFVVLGRADELLMALTDAETGERGYVLTGDEAFLAPYLAVRDRIRDRLGALRQLSGHSAALPTLDTVVPLVDAKLTELSQIVELRRTAGMTAAAAAVTAGRGKRLMDSIRAGMANYAQAEEATLARHDADFQSNLSLLLTLVLAASNVALVLALLSAYLIYRDSRHRVETLGLRHTGQLLEYQQAANAQLELANATLQASEEQLAVTLHSIGDAVIATDADGRVTLLNPLAERLTGWTLAAALNRPVDEIFRIISHDTRQPSTIPVEETLAKGTVQGLANHTILIARDGGECAIADSCAPIRNRDGRIIGAVLVFRDVSKAFEAQQALRAADILLHRKNLELEDASRMKSEFLANMSHELRTPLNAIIGFSEVLRDGLMGEMTAQQRGFIGDIFSSGQHLLALINDILDLSKVEAGKMMLDLEPVLVSSLVADSLSIVREKAAAQHVRLTLDAGSDMGSIRVDPRKVRQIVYNLLSNAVKFTAAEGQVTLRAVRVPRAGVGRLSGIRAGRVFPLAASDFTEFLEISVTDSGIGISRKGLERLFRPFSQIDSSLARQFEGTGLGLAMVKLLVELHGGTVAVDSAEGQGSCFTVWLPLRSGDTADRCADVPPAVRDTAGPAATPGVSIALVVEDDAKSAELIRVQLEAEGFTVLPAASAEEAMELAHRQRLSLITLDIILPGMDGWEFLRRIRMDPSLKRLPVVIISIVADRKRGLALGASTVLQKPVSRDDFTAAVRRAMSLSVAVV